MHLTTGDALVLKGMKRLDLYGGLYECATFDGTHWGSNRQALSQGEMFVTFPESIDALAQRDLITVEGQAPTRRAQINNNGREALRLW